VRRRLVWIAGFVIVVLVAAVLVRGTGISSRRNSFPGEERLARTAWRYLVPSDVRSAANPVPDTPETRQAGLEHFADHCAACHASTGSGETAIGRNVYPPVRDLRGGRSQDLTDGELFYAIEQGIPWTAMPAWGNGTPEGVRSSWELVRFIRHLPSLTADELTAMERLNPKSAADLAQDKAIEDFLAGGKTPPAGKEHRHK
jgi:mono/diheme cytochrome c family protein